MTDEKKPRLAWEWSGATKRLTATIGNDELSFSWGDYPQKVRDEAAARGFKDMCADGVAGLTKNIDSAAGRRAIFDAIRARMIAYKYGHLTARDMFTDVPDAAAYISAVHAKRGESVSAESVVEKLCAMTPEKRAEMFARPDVKLGIAEIRTERARIIAAESGVSDDTLLGMLA